MRAKGSQPPATKQSFLNREWVVLDGQQVGRDHPDLVPEQPLLVAALAGAQVSELHGLVDPGGRKVWTTISQPLST